MTPKFKEQFERAIASRIPVIEVKTSEWFRFCLYLSEKYCNSDLPKGKRKTIMLWTPSRGFVPFTKNYDAFNPDDPDYKGKYDELKQTINNPNRALQYIQELKDPDKELNMLFVFRDLDQFYAGSHSNPVIRQLIRDLFRKGQSYRINVIFCNSVGVTLPSELQKDVYSLSMGYPSEEDIQEIFNYTKKEVEKASQHKEGLNYKKLSENEEYQIIDSLKGLTADEIRHCLKGGIMSLKQISTDIIPLIIEEKQQIVKKSGILDFHPLNESLETVGGLDNLKEWLIRRKDCFSKEARDFGIPYPKGVLLVGVQGTGKSHTCKAIGSFYKIPILRLDVGALMGSHVGESEANTRRAIEMAEASCPALFFIDEINFGLLLSVN